MTPHTLRHSFATHLLEQNIDSRVIQVLLGTPSSTRRRVYTQVATNMIRAVMSPLDRLTPLTRQTTDPSRRPEARPRVSRPALEVADIFRDHGPRGVKPTPAM